MTSETGTSCKESPSSVQEGAEEKRVTVTLIIALALTIFVAGTLDLVAKGVPLGFAIPILNESATASRIIYYVIIFASAAYISYLALQELFVEHRFSVEFLMAVAALGALFIGYFFEAAKARVLVEDLEETVNVAGVDRGTTILVKPGERIPLDGNVIEGFSNVDQALVTGESIPVMKTANDCVYAGTLNTSGVLKIVVIKKADETLVSRIVELVTESGKRKASIERLVDRFAKVYVPIVIALALITAVLFPQFFGGGYEMWVYRSLILLVVSCPSAFIISVPATVFVAITIAAKRGVIIKGGIFVEKLARIKTVIFDKTGTLTLGRPAVHEIRSLERPQEEVLAYAAAIDQFSNHPVAKAIVHRAVERGINISKFKVTDVLEVPGKGIVGNVDGSFVAVGNPELMKEFGCNCREAYEISESDTHTAVCVSVGKEGLASVCVVDEVRDDAVRAVNSLKN